MNPYEEMYDKLAHYEDLMYKTIREINELYYNSLIDPNWRKSFGDYQRVAITFTQLGIALEDIVAATKVLSKERKPGVR